MENNNGEMKNEKHICKHGDCCGGCCGCSCHHGSRSYGHRFLILVVIVILAFWCGYKLGIVKGLMKSVYGGMHMRYNRGYVQPLPQAPLPEVQETIEAEPAQ